MQDAVLHNIFKIPATFGLRGGDRPATVIIAKLGGFLFVQDSYPLEHNIYIMHRYFYFVPG